MVRFAQLRREDCKCRILTGKGHAFKSSKLRLWDPLLSPWKQEIQLEDELTKLPRRGKLLTSLPWWWLRDVVVCWSLFYSNFVLTFTFPTSATLLLLLQGRASEAAFFLSFFLLYFARRENWPAKTGLFSRIVRFPRFSFQGTQRHPTNAALTWLYSRDTIAGCIYASHTIARLASLAWTTLLKKKSQTPHKMYRDMSPHILLLPSYHTSFKKIF